MQLERKIEASRSHALLDHPFFGTLLCPMQMKPRNEIDTFATNGVSIFYNEEYADSLSTELVTGVLLHEVMHCGFFHVTRRGTRNPMVWNMACDYAINPLLVKYDIKLPEGALLDEKYDGWSADATHHETHLENAGIIGELKTKLDPLKVPSNVKVLCATNYAGKVEGALKSRLGDPHEVPATVEVPACARAI